MYRQAEWMCGRSVDFLLGPQMTVPIRGTRPLLSDKDAGRAAGKMRASTTSLAQRQVKRWFQMWSQNSRSSPSDSTAPAASGPLDSLPRTYGRACPGALDCVRSCLGHGPTTVGLSFGLFVCLGHDPCPSLPWSILLAVTSPWAIGRQRGSEKVPGEDWQTMDRLEWYHYRLLESHD
jgi:hypothetical protein